MTCLTFFSWFIVFNSTVAFPAIRCGGSSEFSGEINLHVKSYLFLKTGWKPSKTSFETSDKPTLDQPIQVFLQGTEATRRHGAQDSLTNTIRPERTLSSIAVGARGFDLSGAIGNYRGGQPKPAEREARRAELEKILAYETDFWRKSDEIIEEFGEVSTAYILDVIYREIAECTIQFLLAEGVRLNILNADGELFAQIVPEGSHVLNRRAAQLSREYEGLKVYFKSNMGQRGAYDPYHHSMELSSTELLALSAKSSTMGHELRHAKNNKEGKRDFGGARAQMGDELPGNPLAYPHSQSYGEAEPTSYSLREDAKHLLKLYQMGKLDRVADLELNLTNDAFVANIIAERNELITPILKQAVDDGVQLEFDQEYIGESFVPTSVAHIPLFYMGKQFEYVMTIHDTTLTTRELRIGYIRSKIDHMEMLNPNYAMQFLVTLQATEALSNAKTPQEKMAVLEGIISITRPHYWEQERFVRITESELVERFNKVVSDRLSRFANQP